MMRGSSVASLKLSDVLRPKDPGEAVNVHVVERTKEPEPDFAAMQRIIAGTESPPESVKQRDREK
jgi:hypothetical protein